MIEFVEKKDLEEWGTELKREIYAEVEKALTIASIVQAPVIPESELPKPRIDLIPEGATQEQMDKIEHQGKVYASDGRGWIDEDVFNLKAEVEHEDSPVSGK